jgi:hypothetical protein
MATTTPNFGWVVPTSTDLVKDGATAIETLGDSIDSSMADLKGGTTGQVLSKTSNTDMDFTWVAQDDSNAIQNAIVTAKGDLIGATANATPAKLAVGTNGQVLSADSTASTGLKWISAASNSGPAFSVYRNTDQSVSSSTWTKIALNAETFDTDNCFDSTTNYRFTPTKSGYYSMTGALGAYMSATNGSISISMYKNGSGFKYTYGATAVLSYGTVQVTELVYMNGTTDYLELYGWISGSSATFQTDAPITHFAGVWIRS